MSARIVHGYTGLFFCAILAFLSGTGTLSVFSVELDWLMRAEMRVAADGNKAPVGQSLDAALAAAAGVRPIALMRFPGARFADRVLVASDDAGRRFVWVDPYSGQVRGTTPTATLKETLRELHRGLSTKARLVQVAVAALSLPLALSVISGLVLYRRFWTGFFRMPRRTGSRRALLSDLHRLTAVWSLPFLAIVVITSAVFLSEMVGFGPPMRPMPRPDPIRAEALPPGFGGADLDRAVAQAAALIPDFQLTDVQFPTSGNAPLTIRGTDGTLLVRSDSSVVHLDPVRTMTQGSGSDSAAAGVFAVQPAAAMGPRLRVFEAVRVVHYGTLAGLPTRILWSVFGLGLMALGVLGALICAERLRKEFQVRGRIARSGLRHVLSGPGIGNWPGILTIAVAIALAVRAFV